MHQSLFDTLAAPQPDPIIRLMQMFRDDPRPGRIDLGVGVYRDDAGHTPLMRAAAAAEARLVARQEGRAYVGLLGDPAFLAAMRGLVLGGAVPDTRVAAAAAPGGTGAIRQVLELVRLRRPEATVWIGTPSWPNHAAIISALGLGMAQMRHLDPSTGQFDAAAMLADLEAAAPGDIVLLHACCHNPSGADPAPGDWADIAALCDRRGLIPFVDMAYQGFGEGVEADAGGLRHLAARLPEMLVAVSGSKSFGLYRERVGVAMAICSEAAAGPVTATLASLNRQNFAFPPDHGARIATEVLTDPVLRADWEDELAAIRARIGAARAALAAALRAATGTGRFDFLTMHRGMFSLLGLAPAQVAALRQDHAIYLIGDSRINMAGLTEAAIPTVAAGLAATLQRTAAA